MATMADVHSATRPTALITGASSGIGFATARDLALAGWEVACASRPGGAGPEAVERLRRDTGSESLHFLPADLSRPQQAVALATSFRERFTRLDALVNNAGAYVARRVVTRDGLELTFALNHLGAFALTAELLPELSDSGGRVVTVSSDAAKAARLQLDDPNSTKLYNGWLAYAWSKLCNQLFTGELARRSARLGIDAFAMHPGFVATSFGHTGGWSERAVRLGQKLFGRSPERAADTVVWLASSSEPSGRNGAYFVDRRERPFAAKARDQRAQQRLWELSEELVSTALARGASSSSWGTPGVRRSSDRALAGP